METFTLDLDLPPDKRWRGIPENCKKTIRYSLGDIWSIFKCKNDPMYHLLTQATFNNVEKFTPVHYKEEMKTIADEAGVTFEDIVILNFLHDFESMSCTSIIARGDDGNIVVGQNYDSKIYESGIHKLFEVNYKRDGEIIGKGLHTMGQIGPLYSYIHGRYSLSSSRIDHGSKGNQLFKEMVETYNRDKRVSPFNLASRENFVDRRIESLVQMKEPVNLLQYLTHQIVVIGDNQTAYILEKDYETTQNEYQLGHDGNLFIVTANQDWAIRGGRQAAIEGKLASIGNKAFNSMIMLDQIMAKRPGFVYKSNNNKMFQRTTSSFIIKDGAIDAFNWE